jgi:hypothetical protein
MKMIIIPLFQDLYRKISILQHKDMLSFNSRIPKFQKKASLQPVLPLVPLKLPSAEDEKGMLLSFELMARVGQPSTSTKYKKQERKFEEGTPQQWIDLLRDLQEIWTQISVNEGTDWASTVRAVVKGESITLFKTSLQEARTNDKGEEQAMTSAHVDTALNGVATTMFPHSIVHPKHTSASCNAPGENHRTNATLENRMGGINKISLGRSGKQRRLEV